MKVACPKMGMEKKWNVLLDKNKALFCRKYTRIFISAWLSTLASGSLSTQILSQNV
jgi:hypothetical protein